MNKDSELHIFIAIKNTFFSQVSIGISANTILLLFHILTSLPGRRPKPTSMTIGHLALIHLLMLLVMGVITTDILGSCGFWNDLTCKSVIYLYRVMRGLSICTTCMLSVLQAITLSPRGSCLAKFKCKSSNENLFSLFFLWVFNMFTSIRFLVSTVATPNVTSDNLLFITESCSLWPLSYFLKYLFSTLVTIRDIGPIGLMAISSGYIVTLLCRHKRQSRHLHRNCLSPKTSPEQRATQTILLLMSFFVVMYFFDYIIYLTLGMFRNNDPLSLCVQMVVGNSYATISPLVLISTEKQTTKFLKSLWGKTNKCLIVQ
ncbi:vomeronasal type-1 receptor 90-like [Ctenodactylus gundi]